MLDHSDLVTAFEQYNELLYKYVYVRVGEQDIAEELTQDVFLKAWHARSRFDPRKASLKTWLFAIALNTIRDHLRNPKIHAELNEETAPVLESVAQAVEHQQLHEQILALMHTLRPIDQELLTLRYINELSPREIAIIAQQPYGVIKVRLHRALTKLRNLCHGNLEF
ncbi:MAG TPA: RNA polymerase sigma factor [bacterium]|nr:RNA polymerase sigma factor [bacterium]